MCSCKMPCQLQVNQTTHFKNQTSPYFSVYKVCVLNTCSEVVTMWIEQRKCYIPTWQRNPAYWPSELPQVKYTGLGCLFHGKPRHAYIQCWTKINMDVFVIITTE